jgi:hypothetical protein
VPFSVWNKKPSFRFSDEISQHLSEQGIKIKFPQTLFRRQASAGRIDPGRRVQ